ncbi:hypothetical protein [Wolinella succinogenes]|nr:hypothetical protein [Wolinella succinogenes]
MILSKESLKAVSDSLVETALRLSLDKIRASKILEASNERS